MKHTCLALGCPRKIEARFAMCGVHWAMVPLETQRAVYAAYKPGQTIATASQAWHDAIELARAAVVAARAKAVRP